MLPARLRVAARAVALAHRARAARRREIDALARTGALLASSPGTRAVETLRPLVELVAEGCRRRDALETALVASLQADRTDYAAVAPWMRPTVVVRGLCGSAVLRHQRARLRRDLDAACVALGAAALDTRNQPAVVPPVLAEAVFSARADAEAAVADREALLAPYGGTPLPAACHRLAREIGLAGRAVWGQTRGRLLPRAPALAGMAAGWWVTQAYTDADWLGGLGLHGATAAAGSGADGALRVWLPLVAALLCAYVGARLASAIRRRYAPPDTARAPLGTPAAAGTRR